MSAGAAAMAGRGRLSGRARRVSALATLVGLVALLSLLSVAVGSRTIPLDRVWELLWHPDGSHDAGVIHDGRLPRTAMGLLVGTALGAAGMLMQALTRNPLADPGILGVNAGAATAVVLAVTFLGTTEPLVFVWFAVLGAAVAATVVYVLGSAGRSAATPVRMALAGTAVSVSLAAVVQALTLLRPRVLDEYRYWAVGSLAAPDPAVLWRLAPLIGAGALLALLLVRPLNALALGEEGARALGARVGATRALGALAVTLLCGAATAIAGPIGFVGLMVPHAARALVGPDQRWAMPFAMALGPCLLLAADVLGRVVVRPAEVEAGIVTAILGGLVFVALVRHRRVAEL